MKYSLHKFLGAYLLLLVLIPTTIYLSKNSNRVGDTRSRASQQTNQVYFWPTQAQLQVNQSYSAEVRIEAEKNPENLDLVFSFDPTVIQIENNGPVPGVAYSTYQARFYDNTKGLFGLGGRSGTTNGNVFETIKFKTIKAGDPEIRVNYLNSGDQKLEVKLPEYTVE